MFDNKLWLAEPFTKAQAWIDLFANANHEEGSFWVRGNEVVIKRGQIGWSEVTMTRRWRWSRDKVRRFLAHLEHESNIRQQKTPITSIITIVNYDKYQDTIQQKDSRQDSRQDTNKNDKKNKNEKNKTNTSDVPSQEVVELIESFKEVNPMYSKWFANKTQRDACERLIKINGLDRLKKIVAFLPKSNSTEYMPVVTSPLQLEDKFGQLASSWQKLKNKEPLII